MPPTSLILIANALGTACLVGLIWFVQIVHYPLFTQVGRDSFVAYEEAHTNLTGFVVAPFMLVELATAALLLWSRPDYVPLWAAALGFALVCFVWAITFLLSVPNHNILLSGFDPHAQAMLVWTNWLRTAAWTLRLALVGWFLSRGLR